MNNTIPSETVISWDAHNWAKALAFWETRLPTDRKLKVLELGCGPGGVSLWLAAKGHEVRCSDIELPGQPVRDLHAAHGFANGIAYEQIDAKEIPYENAFDVIVTKSVLGGVGFGHDTDKIAKAVAQIHRALKPGGLYLFAENLTGTCLHRTLRARFRRWGSGWHYFGHDELLAHFGGFAAVERRTAGFLGLFGWNEPVRRCLGWLDTVIFDRLVPAKQRYILMGAARK